VSKPPFGQATPNARKNIAMNEELLMQIGAYGCAAGAPGPTDARLEST
jgi:hypothetical protein